LIDSNLAKLYTIGKKTGSKLYPALAISKAISNLSGLSDCKIDTNSLLNSGKLEIFLPEYSKLPLEFGGFPSKFFPLQMIKSISLSNMLPFPIVSVSNGKGSNSYSISAILTVSANDNFVINMIGIMTRDKNLGLNMKELVICKELSYSIGYKKIFTNISFTIFKNEIVLLSGENGSGKSSLLKVILHYFKNSKQFIWEEKSPSISYLGHELGLYTSLTLKENLDYFQNISKNKNFEFDELLDTFKLKKFIHSSVNTFSEGMKRKAGIIRALCPNANLLLLDEPFNGLDNNSSNALKKILLNYKLNIGSVLIVTHEKEKISDLYSREIILSNGNLK